MELLIVIVVIAILAAITIVAYTGIQNRAYDSAVQSDLKAMATKIELYMAEESTLPRGSQIDTLGIAVSESAYDILWSGSSTDYGFLYCSPQSNDYALVARSKSGTVYRYGTAGNGEFTMPGSTSTITVCAAAGAATSDTSDTSRQFLYQNGWASWVQ